MAKTMFLLGAGADADYNILTGGSFFEEILNFKDERIKEIFNKNIKSTPLLHHNSKRIYATTIIENKDVLKNKFSENLDIIEAYYNGKLEVTRKSDYDNLCKRWYELLTKSDFNLTNESKEEKAFFLKHMLLFDELDGKFNTLRYVRNLNENSFTNKVISNYQKIFMLIFDAVYKNNNARNLTDVLTYLEGDYDVTDLKGKYYSIIKDSGLNYNIATTNYTPIAETITGKKAIYLHGNLKWFEDLKHLTIYEVGKDTASILENKNTIVPFIMIPSGVKPLICTKQMLEYANFIDELEKSDILVILGYRFNSEDNHINSIIFDWIRNNSNAQVYYFRYIPNTGEPEQNLFELDIFENNPKIKEKFKILELKEKNYEVLKDLLDTLKKQ